MADDRAKLINLIKKHEGFSKYPYVDTVEKVTIGWGHNLSDRGLSDAMLDAILDEDIKIAIRDAITVLPEHFSGLCEARKAVLVNMAFNLGLKRLQSFVFMLAAIKSEDWIRAGNEMLNSLWAQQVGRRADELSLIMKTGKFLEK